MARVLLIEDSPGDAEGTCVLLRSAFGVATAGMTGMRPKPARARLSRRSRAEQALPGTPPDEGTCPTGGTLPSVSSR